MPKAIILYEIDKSFGPNVLAEYYSKQNDKIPKEVLKEFSEKHVEKELLGVTIRKDDNRYFSKKINAESINKNNLYLSFILQEEEDLVSLKSIFENIEAKTIQNFTEDKKEMNEFFKNELNSILSLMQKLKEPKIIKETINERTKKMLDDGKLSEARELIDLGEEIPTKLADEVKLAEQLLNENFYKKAKKSFLKAAELARIIQEDEIALFLENKGDQVGFFPDLIKERETLYKEIEKISNDLNSTQLFMYNNFIEPIDRLIEISHAFEDHGLIDMLTKLKNYTQRASRLTKELNDLDDKIKELTKKI
ncbi:MAG: hypothetical protein JSV23_02680 [Promethearchaeota archaeon]|nr:MAG: hypothetical protein JSV23_02680 [Candidatus Lokiarchaeota archaeon]